MILLVPSILLRIFVIAPEQPPHVIPTVKFTTLVIVKNSFRRWLQRLLLFLERRRSWWSKLNWSSYRSTTDLEMKVSNNKKQLPYDSWSHLNFEVKWITNYCCNFWCLLPIFTLKSGNLFFFKTMLCISERKELFQMNIRRISTNVIRTSQRGR